MAIYEREMTLLLNTEASYGVMPALVAADAILASDVRIMPMEGEDLSRNLELPAMGAQGTLPVNLHAKISFKVELTPSGTAGAAPIVGKLLRACGCAEVVTNGVSVAYNPVTNGHESVAVHLWYSGTRYAVTGARGDATIRVNASGIPVLEVELTGLFTQPTDAARVTASVASQLANVPVVATTANTPTFTLNGVACVMRSFSLKMGNKVEPRFLVGSEKVLITDRQDSIETTVEAVPLSAFDPYALSHAATLFPVNLVHGTAAGKIVTFNAPTAQMQRASGLEAKQGLIEWPLKITPNMNAGNDQWSLTFT